MTHLVRYMADLFEVEMSHQPERALTPSLVIHNRATYISGRNESSAREGIDTDTYPHHPTH